MSGREEPSEASPRSSPAVHGGTSVLRSRRVVLPDGEAAATVCVVDGRIADIGPYSARCDEDLGALALLPGLVDTHVHVNEPGRTEWEGFATATRAAAAGGVTTIVDMPLNSLPPTCDVRALARKRAAAADQSYVDVGCWGGAIPGNAGELPALHEQGVFGFKAFLVDSGVAEFPPLDRAGLLAAQRAVDALFVVHAEDADALRPAVGSRRYADFLASRPPAAERSAVATAIAVARETGRRTHILHLSAADALPLLAQAQADGLPVTAETCPHYLTLTAEQVPDGATQFKCCPPIRDAANQDELWQGLANGTVHCVVSDHSPCTPELKRLDTGDFAAAWGGISSLQLGLPLMWTAAGARGFGLPDVVTWMSRRTADLVGLVYKGRIEIGADADLVAFDPDEMSTVDPAVLRHRHAVTPYAGVQVRGVVKRTWLRGVPVSEPRGRLLWRDRRD
jgi:allantoinase